MSSEEEGTCDYDNAQTVLNEQESDCHTDLEPEDADADETNECSSMTCNTLIKDVAARFSNTIDCDLYRIHSMFDDVDTYLNHCFEKVLERATSTPTPAETPESPPAIETPIPVEKTEPPPETTKPPAPASTPETPSSIDTEETPSPVHTSEVLPQDDTPEPSSATITAHENSPFYTNKWIVGGVAVGVVVILTLIAVYCCKRKRKSSSATERDIEIARPPPTAVDSDVDYRPLHGKRTLTNASPRRSSNMDTTGSTARSSQRDTVASTAMSISSSAPNSQSGARLNSNNRYSVGSLNSNDRPRQGGRHKADDFWDDPTILAIRIPRDMIFFGPLISRGGFGEVFKGTYNGETVAIKQLLPERRKHLAQIDEFLAEVKLMAALEHERVVRLIGVAWTALSDACVVVEYMDRGDLRSVVTQWDTGNNFGNDDGSVGESSSRENTLGVSLDWRPRGFDADKVKIAIHVAHALTYLHSLQPVVVHRDLKSKNILLNEKLDAKVTDFGVSRERANETMTAGVGSSLWMAPEVMVGERYDEKADVFSFGVVLSELDTHQLPYWHATEPETGRKLPDVAILQLVSLGRLRVAFSEDADAELVQLALECVSVDPSQRPTAAQALHRVHSILRTRY